MEVFVVLLQEIYMLINNKITKVFYCKIIVLLVVLLAIILFITGCRGKKEGPSAERQSAESENESSDNPKELEELEQDIESIIRALDGPTASTEKEEDTSKKSDRKESTNKSNTGSTGSDSGDGGSSDGEKKSGEDGAEKDKDKKDNEKNQQSQGSTQSNGGQNQQMGTETQKPTVKDPWQEITPVINKMHFTWNAYAPKAAQKGATQEMLNAFSSSLNGLTNSIVSKNKNLTLISANNCYGSITKLFSIYKKQNVSEVKRLKYYTRNAILSSINSDWTQAGTNITDLKTIWGFLKNMLGEENKKASDTLDFSILELEKVIKEKNQPLTDIKGRITLSNIEEVDKNLKKSSDQSSDQKK